MMASRVLPASPLVEEEEEMTKEQKEAAISRRMEEMKRKNEMIRRRHEEVEADRRAAALAAAAQLKVAAESAAATTGTDMTRTPLPKSAPNLEEPKFSPTPPTTGRGRGQRPLARRPGAPPGPSSPNKRPLDAPRARAPAGRGRGVPKERTPTTPTPGEERKEAPADPEFNYLSDRSRQPGQGQGQGPDDPVSQESRRHAGSFGGRDFQNVKTKMANEQKRLRSEPVPRGGKPPDLTLTMTGRERQQYDSWKKERDQIDERRMARQVDDTGEWRRAWDKEKPDAPNDEPVRRMEPAKRPDFKLEETSLYSDNPSSLDYSFSKFKIDTDLNLNRNNNNNNAECDMNNNNNNDNCNAKCVDSYAKCVDNLEKSETFENRSKSPTKAKSPFKPVAAVKSIESPTEKFTAPHFEKQAVNKCQSRSKRGFRINKYGPQGPGQSYLYYNAHTKSHGITPEKIYQQYEPAESVGDSWDMNMLGPWGLSLDCPLLYPWRAFDHGIGDD